VAARNFFSQIPNCCVRVHEVLVWGIVVAALSSYGCSRSAPTANQPESEPAPVAVEEPPEPPPPKPMALAAISPITLNPGSRALIELHIQRHGNVDPIQVDVSGVPEGVTATFAEIPADQSICRVQFAAAETLGDEAISATLQVTLTASDVNLTQTLELTVNKLTLPTLLPVSEVLLQPGAKTTLMLAIERNGFEGPLNLRVEKLPSRVTGKVGSIPADADSTTLELAADPAAADANQSFRVFATHLGRTIETEVPLQIDRRPFVVNSSIVVTLKPGETQRVQIPIERRSYKGPIQISAADLPEGVTVAPVEAAADATAADVTFVAAADAKERVRSSKIVATAGQLTRSDPMVVRVTKGDSGFLPQDALTADPDLSSSLFRRGSFGGRLTAKSKQALLDAYGGTPESEAAVMRGLQWLAEHQSADGRWSLKNYTEGVAGCDCHSDVENDVQDMDTAGTAFGVLPFLGAGIAHNRAPEGQPELARYQRNVERGIAYLVNNQVNSKEISKTGDLGGNLYAHALGTMALCEAYGLSGDAKLRVPAQMAIKHLVEAQHPAGGGWRYGPKQAGDMSATGWIFLAIRNGQLAGLTIDRAPLTRAERFIDSCAAGPESFKLSQYGYQPNQPAKLTLTAAGLLAHEYLGWKKDNPHLQAGCEHMLQNLPPESAAQLGQIYYYYYATQVLHHREGSDFDLWNHRMREHLIRTQEQSGHAVGSWNPRGTDWGSRGGRLYATSLSLMTLQVYYRHLPLYRSVSRTSSTTGTSGS
jgi:hypothetical protein